MHSAPKVSVIIPTYNCAEFVCRAVESVLVQTTRNYEIIVVDDGSSDDTREVLTAYLGCPQFRYVHQENLGLPAARNSGARMSDSEYLAFLDADDALTPDALELMAAALDASRASWCLIDIEKVKGGLREVRRTALPAGDLLLGVLREDFICRGMFFRRKDFVEIGMYDESMRYREDWDLNIRMFENHKNFVYLDKALYLYTWREGSITTSKRSRVLTYTERLLHKHHRRLADAGDAVVAKIYASNMWGLARDYLYCARDYKRCLACARESLAYDLSLGRMLHPIVHHFRRSLGCV